MSIISFSFFFYVIVALVVYYFLPFKKQNQWLLLLSLIFAFTWSWLLVVLLLAISTFNYGYAHLMMKRDASKRRAFLYFGITFNVLVLLIFRYYDFFVPAMNNLVAKIGLSSSAGLTAMTTIGLSYLTLQTISYLVDVYNKRMKPVENFENFTLYLLYFPKLVSGPIERARQFIPLLEKPRIVDNVTWSRSFALVLLGGVQKLLLAQFLQDRITDAFKFPSNYDAYQLLIQLISFMVYLYLDFAGYTNIVRGVSGFFGIELSINFNNPFFAKTFANFWNRWHISLSHWLRDYIYYPLSRSLMKKFGKEHVLSIAFPLLFTMFVSGLWHGLTWHMVFWGILHGIYQVVERLYQVYCNANIENGKITTRVLYSMIVIFFVLLAWVPFNSEIATSLNYFKVLFTHWTSIDWLGIGKGAFAMIGLTLLFEWGQQKKRDELFMLGWPFLLRTVVISFILFAFFLWVDVYTGDTFIYQGF